MACAALLAAQHSPRSAYADDGAAEIRAGATALLPQATGVSTSRNESAACLKVKRYKISASLDVKKARLEISVVATIKNNTSKTFASLYFRNMAATQLKRAKAKSVGNEGKKTRVVEARNLTTGSDLSFASLKRDKSIVKVKLGAAKLKPGKVARVRLKVVTDVPNAVGKFGYQKVGKGRHFTLNWCFPYLADYRVGKWSLNPLPKAGENRFARVAKYDVTLKAAKGYKVACSGVSKTKKGVTRMKAANLRDFALVVSNVMKKDVARVRGVKIVNWYLPGAYAQQYRADTMCALKDAVAYMSDHVGKSPFSEIDVVQAFSGFGAQSEGCVEYAGLVTLEGDRYYYQASKSGPAVGRLTRAAYHEIVHQWFFAAVGNDEYNEPWLDEGIASYYDKWALWSAVTPTARYLAQAAGVDAGEYVESQRASFRQAMANAETTTGETNLARPYNAYASYFATVYSTGPWFLVQLQETVGDNAFEAIMKDYYATYRLREATIDGFLGVVRSHVSGDEVESLIAKYFQR